jgi:hypothetical protein
MTLQDEYTGARRTQQAWGTAAEVWTENIQKVTDRVATPVLPAVPTPDVTGIVEQWFDFTERIARVNREYVLSVAGVLDTLGGAVRQHADAVGEAVRDQVKAVSHTAKEQVDKVAAAEREAVEAAERKQIEAAEREQAAERQEIEQREQAEREQARAARAAERAKARQARESARERYEGRTKAELAEELAQRDLPKTGNIDELIERLVDADTQ